MSSYINYSKFDKIDVSSDEENNGNHRKPQVTTINKTDKVVLGPDGVTILKEETNQETKNIKKEQEIQFKKKKEKMFERMIRNGAVVPYHYLWNQSLHDICFYIVLPLNTKAKDLEVQINEDSLIVKKRKDTQEENKHTLDIDPKKSKEMEIIIKKKFPYKVSTNEDTQLWEVKKEIIYWKEIFFFANKINNQQTEYNFDENAMKEKEETLLYISLKKKHEIENSYVWWCCLFKEDDFSIDVTTLPDRLTLNNKKANQTYNFKSVWEEAHKIFKENIANKDIPFPIDS